MTTQDAVSAMVRYALAARGEAQASLSRVLGLSQSGVAHRLNGHVPWRVDELDRLAAHFGVDVVDLIASPLPQLVGSAPSGNVAPLRSGRRPVVTRKYVAVNAPLRLVAA